MNNGQKRGQAEMGYERGRCRERLRGGMPSEKDRERGKEREKGEGGMRKKKKKKKKHERD